MLVRKILFPVEPEVSRALEPVVFLPHEFAVLLLAQSVHRFAHVLHDVEPVMDDLSSRSGHMLERGLEVGLPHVHGHRLDARQLRLGELEVVSLKALGLTLISHVLHVAADKIANQAHVVVPFAECLLVHAQIPRGLRLLAFPPPCARPAP